MITHKSDVWSACVTMMNVFISETVNAEAKEQVYFNNSMWSALCIHVYLLD